ncbi:hypothetical protein N0V94_004865 [Neodidymelliopsis sp. IMI 364377]|nr:hypothetical protein N0V94_004865 [Neodidymelliopsis sp. IMI 364377]
MSTNSDEKNMSLYFAEDEDEDFHDTDNESLVMVFQWHDHAAADRFKHPLQKSYGPNGESVRSDLWDEHVARPVRHFQGLGANVEIYKLELRAIEPRIQTRITSLQGKKLDQLYPKSNEFHTSRRSWYLSISPSPDHPDANSKKTKKRFPTLNLADGAMLRWESYVNIRHVYKIDWSLLKPYSNPTTPRVSSFRLERESTVRMVAKSKVLTMYEPGPQVPAALQRTLTSPPRLSTAPLRTITLDEPMMRSPGSEAETATSFASSATPSPCDSDFRTLSGNGNRKLDLPPAEPPDLGTRRSFLSRIWKKLF